MSSPHLAMILAGAVLALAGLAVALPAAWRHRVREPAGAPGKLERYVPHALLAFVAGVALMALPFLLPFPPGSGRTGSPRLPTAAPTVPAPLPAGAAATVPAKTAQPPPSATPVRPAAPTPPAGLPAATRPSPPSVAPSTEDIAGRWSHAGGAVELRAVGPDRFAFQGFDTQGRLVAEGAAVRRGSTLTLTGTVPGLGLPLTGEFQVASGTLIQGELRDPLGRSIPLILTR